MSTLPLPSDLQPVTAPKPRRSTKSSTVKNAVLAKYVAGEPKAKIARDLEMAPGTVTSILSLAEIDAHVLEGRSDCIRMIPRSVRVIGDRLAKGSETAALAILRGTQVLQNQAVQVNVQNNGAMAWMTINQQKVEMAENVQDCPQPDTEAKSDKP